MEQFDILSEVNNELFLKINTITLDAFNKEFVFSYMSFLDSKIKELETEIERLYIKTEVLKRQKELFENSAYLNEKLIEKVNNDNIEYEKQRNKLSYEKQEYSNLRKEITKKFNNNYPYSKYLGEYIEKHRIDK